MTGPSSSRDGDDLFNDDETTRLLSSLIDTAACARFRRAGPNAVAEFGSVDCGWRLVLGGTGRGMPNFVADVPCGRGLGPVESNQCVAERRRHDVERRGGLLVRSDQGGHLAERLEQCRRLAGADLLRLLLLALAAAD